MKTTTLCLIVAVSVTVLVLAILHQSPKKPVKETFATDVKEIGMGVGFGTLIILLVFAGFFFYFYSSPKPPNVLPNKRMYYNME